jgi:membrane dipeptidase
MSRHDDLIVIDGLIVANWSPSVFRALRAGGITATNATCAVWEDARAALDNIARWLRWFDAHADLIVPVRTTADVLAAKQSGRTGIILGFQNGSPIEDRLDYLALYKRLGVGVIQLTYNTQNLIGSGCYESRDSGLSDFGRDVIAEMNRLGIAVDLSHVGPRTSDDAIACSQEPVVFSHVLPAELKQHPRNKETGQLRAAVDKGGLVAVTMFPPFLPKGTASTVDDYAEMIHWMIDRLGEDHVAYGTDFTEGHDERFFEWITRDKGYGRWLTKFGEVKNPRGIQCIEETPNLTAALERRGFTATRIEKVMGQNWLSYLQRVWHE